MRNGSTLYVGLDVHKDSIRIAYASDDGRTVPATRTASAASGASAIR